MISDDIKKVELVQSSLANYVRISNAITKTNTVNFIIEEELKKYQVDLEAKKAKIFKTVERGLHEITVPNDHLSYILGGILEYILVLMPPNVIDP